MADKKANTGYGILSYLGILILIPLLDDDFKKSDYGKFHVNQGLAILIVATAGYLVAAVLSVVLIGFLLFPIVGLLWFVATIMGIIGAAQGEKKKVPVIGDWKILK